jgi:ELWxxDGT repeat protein
LVKDIHPGPVGAAISGLTDVGGIVVFAADDSTHGNELWRSDGTEAGTYMVDDIAPGPSSSAPSNFLRVGNLLYFAADDGVTGRELWAIPLDGLGELPHLPPRLPRTVGFRN